MSDSRHNLIYIKIFVLSTILEKVLKYMHIIRWSIIKSQKNYKKKLQSRLIPLFCLIWTLLQIYKHMQTFFISSGQLKRCIISTDKTVALRFT